MNFLRTRLAAPQLWLTASALLYASFIYLIFDPGSLSPDSLAHWQQALHWQFEDGHPPLNALVMRLAMVLGAKSPAPILFLQAFLLPLAMGQLLLSLQNQLTVGSFLLLLASWFWPAIFLYAQVEWKDVWMTTAFLFAGGNFVRLVSGQTRWHRWLSFSAAAILVTLFRHNGSILVAILAIVLAWRQKHQRAWAFATLFLIFAAPPALSWALHVQSRPLTNVVLVHDFAGIETCDGFADYQPGLASWLPQEILRKQYHPANSVPLFWSAQKAPVINEQKLQAHTQDLRQLWVRTVLHHPLCYLRHRANVFGWLMDWQEPVTCYPYELRIFANPYGLTRHSHIPALLARIQALAQSHIDSLIFRAFPYLAICFLWFLARLWQGDFAATLLFAAFAYEAMYFWVVPACDFRYNWPLVLLALLFTIAALTPRHRTN